LGLTFLLAVRNGQPSPVIPSQVREARNLCWNRFFLWLFPAFRSAGLQPGFLLRFSCSGGFIPPSLYFPVGRRSAPEARHKWT